MMLEHIDLTVHKYLKMYYVYKVYSLLIIINVPQMPSVTLTARQLVTDALCNTCH